MKKFCFILIIAVLVTIVIYAAPIVLGAALLRRGTNIVSEALDIPDWIGLLIFLALVPSCFLLVIRIFSGKSRKRAAIFLMAAAILFCLATAVMNHQQELAEVTTKVKKWFCPLRRVDPKSAAWFTPSGEAILFYAHLKTNSWIFYDAYPGAHDPDSGSELQPVTSSLRQEWEAAQESETTLTTANKQLVTEIESQKKIEQLQIAAATLKSEKEDRIRREESFLNSLTQTLQAKQAELASVENALIANSPQQSAHDARQRLEDAKRALSDAVKESRNGAPLDLAGLHILAQTVLRKIEQAKEEISYAVAARKIKGQQVAREPAAQKAQRVPETKSATESNSPTVTVTFKNETPFKLYVTFSSPEYRHVWPVPGTAYVAQSGQTIAVSLLALSGEPIFFTAWSPENPQVRWENCPCNSPPIAVGGKADPPLRVFTEKR